MFILIPAIIADRCPPAYVAWTGAVMVAVGYILFATGMLSDSDGHLYQAWYAQ